MVSTKSRCTKPYHVSALGKTQILSSDTTLNSDCGSEAAPWIIQAKPGQQINITLIDFYWGDQKSKETCLVEYGYIIDGETSDIATICGGSDRIKHLQVSKGSMIQVALRQETLVEHRFLLEYSGRYHYSMIKLWF